MKDSLNPLICAMCGEEAVTIVLGAWRCEEHRETTVVRAPKEPGLCYTLCVDNVHKCGK